jgi:RNA polymerase sigma-70 factor (ECF subfamily)
LDFEAIVNSYKNKVYNTCLGFIKNEQDAEDLAQEVFIEVYKNIDGFRGDAEIGTWIYRIAVNKSIEALRKSKTQKRRGQMASIEQQDITDTNTFSHPGIKLENKERAKVLFKAIELLPENQRVAFTLQKVEGLTVVEISKVMKKSSSSIASLLIRAKENLRKGLQIYYESNEFKS